MTHLSPRQVHLDFHTSPYIPAIGQDFDAVAFASTVKNAHVSSMTVFARCHHGHLYYDSKAFPERIHPQLAARNLMIDQVRALHAVDIRAPIYITVQWDYYTATTHPEWLIRDAAGAHEGPSFTQPGFYQSLCVNTGYFDFLTAQTAEAMDVLGDELDGIFFDITGIRPCLCASCRKAMRALGINMSDETAVREFAVDTMNQFKEKMSAFVRARRPDATIFYNAGHVGPCTHKTRDAYSHFELESLPGGSWGYLHFPLTARYARNLDHDCLGMTGKFHTAWGDFHSLKNLAALEFEAFRMLSFGFACSIGDQLHPRGVLQAATYDLIGKVYEQFESREQWARPSCALVEAAVLTPEPTNAEFAIPESIFGACQVLDEIGLQYDIIDVNMDFSRYPLLILPDDRILCASMQQKLTNYVSAGGHVISCARGGADEQGNYPACFGISCAIPNPVYPDFLLAQGDLAAGLYKDNPYVMYMQGIRAQLVDASPVLCAALPYFAREGDHFCSHLYTPSAQAETYPCATRKGNVLWFSHPLFLQYRKNAPLWIKQLLRNALASMLPCRLVTHDGPSTLTVTLLDQQNRTCAHILSYIPVRKSQEMDLIEERTPAYHVTFDFSLPRAFTKARLVPENIDLPVKDGQVYIEKIDGYAIVELS